MKHRSYKDTEKAAKKVLVRVGGAASMGGAASDSADSAARTAAAIRDDEVLDCLRRLPFSENRLRRNVIPDDARHVYSQCAGLTVARRTQLLGPTKSKIAAKCPNLVRVLSLYCRQAEHRAEQGAAPLGGGGVGGGGEHDADTSGLRFLGGRFAFTSITLNFNYAAKPHVDSSHVDGLARIIALGSFSGGELTVSGMGKLDVRHRWIDFDGRTLHQVEPFEGERYSLVYFAHEAALAPEPKDGGALRRELEAMAMRWPTHERLAQSRRRMLCTTAAFALLSAACSRLPLPRLR